MHLVDTIQDKTKSHESVFSQLEYPLPQLGGTVLLAEDNEDIQNFFENFKGFWAFGRYRGKWKTGDGEGIR